MIFVDTNVFMYAVGGPHPFKAKAREFFLGQRDSGEVLHELLHAYLPLSRMGTLEAALTLARTQTGAIWSLEHEDVEMAHSLATAHPALSARDLVHVARCRRRGVERVKTYDRGLASAFV
jgi:predicted nucleic acid-binding protein